MQLLENGLQQAGKGKMLVPKAIDADDEDDPGPSDEDSDDDEVGDMEFGELHMTAPMNTWHGLEALRNARSSFRACFSSEPQQL